MQTRDLRITANAMIATADPPYAALSFGLGFDGTVYADVAVPALDTIIQALVPPHTRMLMS